MLCISCGQELTTSVLHTCNPSAETASMLVICQACHEDGLRSRVYPGVGSVTAAYYQPFYDEVGRYHDHDNNTLTTQFTCAKGHRWTVQGPAGSCWCGWPKTKEVEQ